MAGEFNQLRNFAPEPQLGDSEKTHADNQEYAAQTMNFDEEKDRLKQDLYGQFTQEEPQSAIEKQQINIVQDSIYYPILESLAEGDHVPKDIINSIVDEMSNENESGQEKILKNVLGDIADTELVSQINNFLDGDIPEVTEENFEKSDFYLDVQQSGFEITEVPAGLEILLANNYMSIPDAKGNTDNMRDFSMAMDRSLNQILKSNSPDFRQKNADLISRIREATNINSKYQILTEVYKNDLAYDAQKGGGKLSKEVALRQKKLKKKAEEITQQIIEAQKHTHGQEAQNQHLQDLLAQREEIIAQAQGVDRFEGEVFAAGKLDKTSESMAA
ncbi:hypothetical protein MK079_02900 [Candidatus Gracilibacteria bacterium]|nr:hypothetical protein [Candidatus Gracilibacteria bacterium]